MMTLIEAIAREEGWGVRNAIPTRDNNPGDIVAGRFTQSHGATGASGRFATFATPEDGFAALRALLLDAYVGLTLKDALTKYAPPVENQTNAYITNVRLWTGLLPDSILTPDNIG